MPYTISSTLDVNAQVDVGNLRFNTNTISSIDTNGNIILSPDGTGKIGIGMTPSHTLDINPISGTHALHINGDCGGEIQAYLRGNSYGMRIDVNNSLASNYALALVNSSNADMLYVQNNGLVGVGTSEPKAVLHVTSANSGVTLSSGSRRYFKHNAAIASDTGTWAFSDVSVYGTGDIITNGWILSHDSGTFSDARMKNSIIDIDDDSALNTLRLIKPKRYNYTDTVLKGSEPVWGFIAQEVSSVLDYAVTNITKEIPNIYKQANVSEGNILTIDGFDTSSLSNDSEGNLVTKLMLKTSTNKDIEVTIDTILSSNSIRLTEALEEEDINGTVDNEPFTNEIFVYGQIVDDFRALKKDAIFTVAVAALQEIDRRQTADNQTIVELETENALQAETIATLQDQVATLQVQVAALLQHTGVTV